MILNILHTNDIHSNYENFSKIVGKIRELKDENTIILDAGDFADFKRLELQGTDGVAAVELLQCAGYNAIAIGNNETFNGLETLINMATKSKVPFLSSNLYKLGFEPIEGVRKSFILNNNGLRILIIGASPDLGAFTALAGLEAKDYVEAVREEIKTNEGSYDVCILLSHLGMDRDKEIAEKVQGVDIIVGGHFHILMDNPEIINNTIIHTSGCYGEHIGMLKIKIEDKKVKLIEGKNISIEGCSSSEDIIQILKENKEKAIDNLSKPLYSIDVDLWHDVIEENPMTNLLADALVDVLNCDIGIINSGVLNGGIRKGPVSIKKLLEVCPSPLNPTTFEIEGKHIREALENSMDSDICLMDGKGPGFRGRYLGRLHLSNAIVEHDGRRIKNILIKGEPLQDNKVYTVATSDYLQRGTGYSSLKSNVNEKYNEEYLRDTLREYIEKSEFIQRAFAHRWILK